MSLFQKCQLGSLVDAGCCCLVQRARCSNPRLIVSLLCLPVIPIPHSKHGCLQAYQFVSPSNQVVFVCREGPKVGDASARLLRTSLAISNLHGASSCSSSALGSDPSSTKIWCPSPLKACTLGKRRLQLEMLSKSSRLECRQLAWKPTLQAFTIITGPPVCHQSRDSRCCPACVTAVGLSLFGRGRLLHGP